MDSPPIEQGFNFSSPLPGCLLPSSHFWWAAHVVEATPGPQPWAGSLAPASVLIREWTGSYWWGKRRQAAVIFLLIEEDKVWFGRYLWGLAASRTTFFFFSFYSSDSVKQPLRIVFSQILSWGWSVSSGHRSSMMGKREQFGVIGFFFPRWREFEVLSQMRPVSRPAPPRDAPGPRSWCQARSTVVVEWAKGCTIQCV